MANAMTIADQSTTPEIPLTGSPGTESTISVEVVMDFEVQAEVRALMETIGLKDDYEIQQLLQAGERRLHNTLRKLNENISDAEIAYLLKRVQQQCLRLFKEGTTTPHDVRMAVEHVEATHFKRVTASMPYRVPLKDRIAAQVATASGWDSMRNAEHLSKDGVVHVWSVLFSQLFSEACDTYRIGPVTFKERFLEMQKTMTEQIEALKWIESQHAGTDVDFAGISPRPTEAERALHPNTRRMSIEFHIEEDPQKIRRGVTIRITFPELKVGQGPETCEMYFPDIEEAA